MPAGCCRLPSSIAWRVVPSPRGRSRAPVSERRWCPVPRNIEDFAVCTMNHSNIRLGINIDHVATVRQARRAQYPDPVHAALLAEQAGADSITVHLREDRRHIQDRDVRALRGLLQTRMNLEMAVTEEMLALACELRPADCCLVPEKRTEVTTEGGLDVASQVPRLQQ